jgi:CBS domain containing-hemolysin-like protein
MELMPILLIALKLGLVLFLVLLNGFFVAAEFAIVKVRETQLQPLVDEGVSRAEAAQRLVKRLDAALSATQLGITLASLGLGWVGEPIFAQLLEPVMGWMNIESEKLKHSLSFAFGFSIITFLHIVAGELAPKSLAIQLPLPTTLWIAKPLELFCKLSYPFVYVLNNTAGWVLRQFGINPVSEGELVHSEEEMRLLLGTQKSSMAAPFGRDIVLNAFDLSRRTVRDVMRPRHEVVALNTAATIAECLDVAEKTRYSRFPLCERNDLDRAIGVVHFKDLFAMRIKARTGADLSPVARKVIYVPPTARLETVLHYFLERKLHFGLVVDEYGGVTGIVTLENILEELVGQIQDEFDQEKVPVQKLSADTWELSGALPLHDLAELVEEDLSDEDIVTVSGWVTQNLGGFPKKGDTVKLGDYTLSVEEMDGARVERLKLKRNPEPVEEEE